MSEAVVFGSEESGVLYQEREGSYGIALNGDKVLVEKARLGYFLPGGGIEEGETVEQTLVREFKEETGYNLVSWRKLGTATEYRGDRKGTGHYFLVELGHKGEPTYDDGHVFPVEWEPVNKVQNKLHLQSHWWAIEEARRTRRGL